MPMLCHGFSAYLYFQTEHGESNRIMTHALAPLLHKYNSRQKSGKSWGKGPKSPEADKYPRFAKSRVQPLPKKVKKL
jgi:hypothetical protein